MDADKEIQLLRNRLKRFEDRVERLMGRVDFVEARCDEEFRARHEPEKFDGVYLVSGAEVTEQQEMADTMPVDAAVRGCGSMTQIMLYAVFWQIKPTSILDLSLFTETEYRRTYGGGTTIVRHIKGVLQRYGLELAKEQNGVLGPLEDRRRAIGFLPRDMTDKSEAA